MSWDDYYMALATAASLKSKDSTKVGAILVDPEGAVILTAFNGPPKGVIDSPDKFVRPDKYMYASHAEVNLVAFAARRGIMTIGCSVYCTHLSCASCARTLIQAGIKELVYGEGRFMDIDHDRKFTEQMFQEAGVILRKYGG